MRTEPETLNASPQWPATIWEMILPLRDATPEVRRNMLSALVNAYRRPVLEYLQSINFSEEEAKDAAQEFFVRVADRRRLFEKAEPERGKLRSLIRCALHKFAQNIIRARLAEKRGGRAEHQELPEDIDTLPFDNEPSPDENFDRAWALGLVERTEYLLISDYKKRGKEQLCESLLPHIERWHGDVSQTEAAAALGINTSTLSTELNRLRERYQRILRTLVFETAASPEEANEDILYLKRLLSS